MGGTRDMIGAGPCRDDGAGRVHWPGSWRGLITLTVSTSPRPALIGRRWW